MTSDIKGLVGHASAGAPKGRGGGLLPVCVWGLLAPGFPWLLEALLQLVSASV